MLETIKEKKELGVKGTVNGITYNINYTVEDNVLMTASCQCVKLLKVKQPTPEGIQEMDMSVPFCDLFYTQGRMSINNLSIEEDRDAEALQQFKKYLKEITPKVAVEIKTGK